MQEVVDSAIMVGSLVEELAAAGLHLNTSKTKILTTQHLKEPMFQGHNHKYLGKKLSGDLRKWQWWMYDIGVKSLG